MTAVVVTHVAGHAEWGKLNSNPTVPLSPCGLHPGEELKSHNGAQTIRFAGPQAVLSHLGSQGLGSVLSGSHRGQGR